MPILDYSESWAITSVRELLLQLLPPDVVVIRAQVNRVPEPAGQNFVVMSPINQVRLSVNQDTSTDSFFVGSCLRNTLSVESISYGSITLGSLVVGSGVTVGTVVTAFVTGTGGVGTYTVSVSQIFTSRSLNAGGYAIFRPMNWQVQLDVHGPNSGDNAGIIAGCLNDDLAFEFMPSILKPLYADDPLEMPFQNGEQQVEWRWIVGAHFHFNQTILVAQEFADNVSVGLINVDVVYPP